MRFFDKWFGDRTLGGIRSPRWSSVRKEFLRKNPECAVCRKRGWLKSNEAHHIIPFSIDKTKELNEENLIILCRQDHYFMGHYNSWRSYNKDVKQDAALWRTKIAERP